MCSSVLVVLVTSVLGCYLLNAAMEKSANTWTMGGFSKKKG